MNKVERVAELVKKVGLDMTLINLSKIKVKSILHESLLHAIFNIVLTSTAMVNNNEQVVKEE